jgi:CheY-like chemotaxis protein
MEGAPRIGTAPVSVSPMAIRIVLIDDHPMVLKGLEQLLQLNADFEVVATCGTAVEGLQAVEALRPDVLLLDLKLPGEDGLSVLRRLDSAKPRRASGRAASFSRPWRRASWKTASGPCTPAG